LASAALAGGCLLGLLLAQTLLPGETIADRGVRVFLAIALGLGALLLAFRSLRHEEMKEILESLPFRRGGES
jgi:hypothetical protein